MRAALILSLMALAACGADGEPIRPTATTTVGVGSDGVSTSTSVTVQRGSFGLGVRL
ncbi:hypothetical protein [Thetidibacter halocola]|uniref:Argininosuccinate lyase n=1 Tax=Thetidibacter halocola TaxID=2827239 RepID=A0A8J7WE55_9RHOB|nr:hypothetical protein [Thetidibacter halocola]MBS0123534.1 hypothetical protein [Thetidibacter halocola]